MRLAEVIDTCCVKTVTVTLEASLVEAARAMLEAEATAIIVENDRFREILTAGDILRRLTMAASPADAWHGPVTAALGEPVATVSGEESVGKAIEMMAAAGIDHQAVAVTQGIVVASLCRLLLAENALLHDEVRHLQNYIDALHDAPND
ncbi:MAG: CBS domain-containing protein [Desulfoprunum sp.]|jgi:CBS domain-containing protein|nr:hypothetical protein JT06_07670 [Desulfobulbus sp. Tol-SR]